MEINNTEVFGFEGAIRGMRNPMNSWKKSDSNILKNMYCSPVFVIGQSDMKLCQSLIKAGPEHSKFMRMIHVQADLNLPRYLWSEFDTYKFIEKNSCSTMHKLLNTDEPITVEAFEHDYSWNEYELMKDIADKLEYLRNLYNETKTLKDITDKQGKLDAILLRAKRILPESFLQMRTIDTNYAELRNLYFQRRNHRLPEWHKICDWIKILPYAEELIMYEGECETNEDR